MIEHRLLKRQLRKVGLQDLDKPPTVDQWHAVLTSISRSYEAADRDRYLLERSIDQVSREMQALYESLRRASESRIAAQRDKLASVFRSIGDGLATLNADGTLSTLNPAGEALLGGDLKSLGEDFLDRVMAHAPDESSGLRGSVRTVILTGETMHVDDAELCRTDGTTFAASYTISPMHQRDAVIGAVLVFRDVTQQRRNEQALREARRAAEAASELKSAFLANMSHELRTPMNAIIGMNDLLLDTELTQEQREFASMVQKSSRHLLELLNSVLDLSKIEAGRLDIDATEFSPRDVLDDIVELFAETAASKGVVLAVSASKRVPERVCGDPGRMRQLLTNLVGNALKFTEEGQVVVRANLRPTPTPGRVTLCCEVEDTGIGIDPKQMPYLFQPFSQVDGSTTRRFGGTGLGLAISKQLAELMGGEICVESRVGKGSRFWFTAAVEPLDSPPRRRPLAGHRAMVVSRHEAIREMVVTMLQEAGFVASGHGNTPSVMGGLLAGQAAGKPVDLLISDRDLPEMTGEAFAREVATLGADAPAFVMLTPLSPTGRTAGLPSGVQARVMTPVRRRPFLGILSRLLKVDIATIEPLAYAPVSKTERRRVVGRQPVVLIAEDNLINQKLTLRLIERLGYQGQAVANGAEAVKAVQNNQFDAVLMDCMMPEMDGYEATARIREAEDESRRIPIIAMTANALDGARENCLAAGMDDYLAKPVDFDTFAHTLARWIEADVASSEGRSTTLPSVDASVLEALRALEKDAPGFFDDLIETFVADAEGHLNALGVALEMSDGITATAATRALRASCMPIGAAEMLALCSEVEVYARGGDDRKASSAFARLHTAFARTRAALVSHRQLAAQESPVGPPVVTIRRTSLAALASSS